jgi:hypothetical protein
VPAEGPRRFQGLYSKRMIEIRATLFLFGAGRSVSKEKGYKNIT